jgi:hypothetical protein
MNNNTHHAIDFVERHGNRKRKDSLSIISQRVTRHDRGVRSRIEISTGALAINTGEFTGKISSRSIYRKRQPLPRRKSGGEK